MKISAILPAAGRSSRLGNPRRHKLLARLEGESLIRRAARRALSCDLAEVVVVTGARAEEISAELRDLPVTLCHNPDYDSGLASTLQCGHAALRDPACDGVLIALPDMPMVEAAGLRALSEAFRAAGGAAVVRAFSGAVPGNPLILPLALHRRFAELSGDIGAKPLLAGQPLIPVDLGLAALQDTDTMEALLALGARFEDEDSGA